VTKAKNNKIIPKQSVVLREGFTLLHRLGWSLLDSSKKNLLDAEDEVVSPYVNVNLKWLIDCRLK
jgi:hypothetical protein